MGMKKRAATESDEKLEDGLEAPVEAGPQLIKCSTRNRLMYNLNSPTTSSGGQQHRPHSTTRLHLCIGVNNLAFRCTCTNLVAPPCLLAKC